MIASRGHILLQAIMMVEDPSGQKALLGRPKKLRNGVLTCLSGFIEQVTFLTHPALL